MRAETVGSAGPTDPGRRAAGIERVAHPHADLGHPEALQRDRPGESAPAGRERHRERGRSAGGQPEAARPRCPARLGGGVRGVERLDELLVHGGHGHPHGDAAAGEGLPHAVRVEAREHPGACPREQRGEQRDAQAVQVVEGEGVEQRVVVAVAPRGAQQLALDGEVLVREPGALGLAGGAARIEEERGVVGGDRSDRGVRCRSAEVSGAKNAPAGGQGGGTLVELRGDDDGVRAGVGGEPGQLARAGRGARAAPPRHLRRGRPGTPRPTRRPAGARWRRAGPPATWYQSRAHPEHAAPPRRGPRRCGSPGRPRWQGRDGPPRAPAGGRGRGNASCFTFRTPAPSKPGKESGPPRVRRA